MWKPYLNGFKIYLQLERSLSENSIEAYLHDVEKLIQYLAIENINLSPDQIKLAHLRKFIEYLNQL